MTNNYDTVTTLIALALASALMIYLGGWLGAGGVALFIVCSLCSKPRPEAAPLQVLKEGAESGCGIILLVVMVLFLARFLGCG